MVDLAVQGKKRIDLVYAGFNAPVSMDGLFLENGPFRVNPDLSLSLNEGGWQNYATNVYCKLGR